MSAATARRGSLPPAPRQTTQAGTCLAFDGSLNSHWVARYAMRMAAAAGGALQLLHVADGAVPGALFEQRVGHVMRECEGAGVACRLHELALRGDVAQVILDAVPAGRDSLLLCGTRARRHGRGLVAGSVSERLLRAGRFVVLALHVLTPGLLGRADRLLLPVVGLPGEARDVMPVLHPLLAGARELHLLRVMETTSRVVDHAPLAELARLRGHGRAAVTDAESQLRAVDDLAAIHVDTHVRIDRSLTHAAAVVARTYHCDLLLAAATDRQLGVGRPGTPPVEQLLASAPCDVGLYRTPG